MRCKIRQIKPWPIWHFDFDNQYDMASTFVRIQEHYESPSNKHREEFFTLDEYMDWYVEKFGIWDYFESWDGFNMPDTTIKSFQKIFSSDLREKEKWALEQLKDVKEPYYIICSYCNDKETIYHEIRHALFYLNKNYAQKVKSIINKCGLKDFKKELKDIGYSNSHMIDEINAYACKWSYDKKTKEMKELSKKLMKVEKEYFGNQIRTSMGA